MCPPKTASFFILFFFNFFFIFSADADDVVRYPFIENFCGDPNELNIYQSLIMVENGVSQNGLFSIEAFSFNGDEDGDIYLHCQVKNILTRCFENRPT